MQRKTLPLCAAIAMGFAACGKQSEPPVAPPEAPPLTASTPSSSPVATPQASAVAATPAPTPLAAEGTRNVRFGDRFQLNGAIVSHDSGGAKVDLNWQSFAAQALNYTISVHVVNDRGDILNEMDRPQGGSGRTVKAGETWQEAILLKADQLKGASAVAICLYHPGADILKADRGRRDWNNVRLWIQLSPQAQTR